MDMTVVNPLQAATVARAATTPGYALTFAADRKVRGAEEECRRQGISFLLGQIPDVNIERKTGAFPPNNTETLLQIKKEDHQYFM